MPNNFVFLSATKTPPNGHFDTIYIYTFLKATHTNHYSNCCCIRQMCFKQTKAYGAFRNMYTHIHPYWHFIRVSYKEPSSWNQCSADWISEHLYFIPSASSKNSKRQPRLLLLPESCSTFNKDTVWFNNMPPNHTDQRYRCGLLAAVGRTNAKTANPPPSQCHYVQQSHFFGRAGLESKH